MMTRTKKFLAALHYAEGALSSGDFSLLRSAYRGAKYTGYRWFGRLAVTIRIARDMNNRNLKPGFDLFRLEEE